MFATNILQMKTLRQLKEDLAKSSFDKIVAEKKFTLVRDGGSHHHKVLNPNECGFCTVRQDFSISAKRSNKVGSWYAIKLPPNHTSDKYVPASIESISFVEP
jgi:hypothetical protein